jgi:hypothetical protein
MKPVVFAGPSVFGLDPALLGGLELRPPAGCGDILRAAAEGAPAIGLIDGLFETQAAAWHKEILYALWLGIPVLGGASMGALRAAECAPYGMTGVGSIFAEYASGARTADADVAVAHAPAELGYAPLSVALVDVEVTLAAMTGAPEAAMARARRLHFKNRTWERVLEGQSPEVIAAAVRYPSRKAGDAAELLRPLRAGEFAPPPRFELNVTGYLTGLAHSLGITLRAPR